MTLCAAVKFSGKISKQGNLLEECEDEFAIFPDKGKFALADGATEASYSKIWARILVEAFCELEALNDIDKFEIWLDSCRCKWSEWEKSLSSKDLPWFTREKLSQGSASTFLGISFDLESVFDAHILWRAVALGDSCLFILQDNRLRLCFPVEKAEDFNNAPPLLKTLAYPVGDDLRIFTGSASAGERIYLATDALASWFLDLYERGGKPWEKLDDIATDADLETFVYECRLKQGMRNDDVALITIEVEAAHRTHE